VWAVVKGWLRKVWLWALLALFVACGVLFALLRMERAKRMIAEARARNAEALAAIRAKRHQAAVDEQAARRDADAQARDELDEIAADRAEAEAEHEAKAAELDAAAGDDGKVRDALREALRRDG
jgi:hypothetical protein